MPNTEDTKTQKHNTAMAKQKAKVDANIAKAQTERGVAVLLTGDGKGKSSSAFGMVMRALGYGQSIGIVQFIKGEQLSGEELFIRDQYSNPPNLSHPSVQLYQMGTGFTWDTQDRTSDIAAAKVTWDKAKALLKDANIDLVVLDELTYMIAYHYLDEDAILQAIQQRPIQQSVIITGRGGGSALRACMDTVSDIKDIKHAFTLGIKARKGVDY